MKAVSPFKWESFTWAQTPPVLIYSTSSSCCHEAGAGGIWCQTRLLPCSGRIVWPGQQWRGQGSLDKVMVSEFLSLLWDEAGNRLLLPCIRWCLTSRGKFYNTPTLFLTNWRRAVVLTQSGFKLDIKTLNNCTKTLYWILNILLILYADTQVQMYVWTQRHVNRTTHTQTGTCTTHITRSARLGF